MIYFTISSFLIFTPFILFYKSGIIKHLAIENLALRHQISVLKRTSKKPLLKNQDRIFWIFLVKFWKDWKQAVIIMEPETIIKWHRKGFKTYWKLKSKRTGKPGRPKLNKEIRQLIKEMANDNPLWGAPRIHGELTKLDFHVSERSVSDLIREVTRKPPSQTWRAFLKNHVGKVSVDFLTVPTATFRVLYVFIILSNERRKIVRFNVTTSPTAVWTSQKIVDAFPWDSAPKYLIRDRDGIYGKHFKRRLKNMGITEVISAPKSPWQNPFVERVIGSIRREYLDHVIVLNENHLRRILSDYIDYYNNDRTHYNLNKDSPNKRKIQYKPDKTAKIIKLPHVGGLHHRYQWYKAA